jgi:hypothetical protein
METKTNGQKEGQERYVFTLKDLKDLNVQSINWLVDGIIPAQGIGMLTGPSDSNKSTLLRQLAYEVVCKSELFLGRKLNSKKGRALIISTEDNAHSTAAIVFKQSFGGVPDDIQDCLTFCFKAPSDPKQIESLIHPEGVDLIILDTWTDTFFGDLNQTVIVRRNLQGYKTIADKYECAIVGIHHAGKGSDEKSPHKGQMLGSQGIEAYSRVVMDLRREESGLNRRLTIVKGNYSSDEVKRQPIMLKLNAETMLLELSDIQPAGYGFSNVIDWDLYRDRILKLREGSFSLKDIALTLASEHPDKKTPGKTAIFDWLKQINSQGVRSDKP